MPGKTGRYRLAPLAEMDLEDIWLYGFRKWSIEQADRYQTDLVTAFENLADGLRLGRPADIRPGYLKYAIGSHIIFYRQADAVLDVIRVLHQSMDANRHL